MGPPPPPQAFDEVIVQYELDKPLIKIAGVPPEEMRIDRYARNFKESRASSATSASCRWIR